MGLIRTGQGLHAAAAAAFQILLLLSSPLLLRRGLFYAHWLLCAPPRPLNICFLSRQRLPSSPCTHTHTSREEALFILLILSGKQQQQLLQSTSTTRCMHVVGSQSSLYSYSSAKRLGGLSTLHEREERRWKKRERERVLMKFR